MPPVGFEPTVSAGERPQTYVLDRAATGTGSVTSNWSLFMTVAVLFLPSPDVYNLWDLASLTAYC